VHHGGSGIHLLKDEGRTTQVLTSDIAAQIVKETMSRLNRNINIMDVDGWIIASGDRKRIGERHLGAAEAIRSGQTVIIGETDKGRQGGVLPGINLPIYFQRRIVGAIGITGCPADVSELGELVRMTTELMVQQTFLTSRQQWRNRLKESIWEEWGKTLPDHGKIEGQLAMLQLKLQSPFRIYFIQLKRSIGYHSQVLLGIQEIWGDEHALIGLWNEHTIGLLVFGVDGRQTEAYIERVKRGLKQAEAGFRIGCSGESTRATDIPTLIKEAEFALSFASEPMEIIAYERVAPQMIVRHSSEPIRTRFLERVFPGVTETMRLTLQAFFDCNRSVQSTAEALYVHKNTVIYRLKKIKEQTGCDPQHFGEAVALQMALWLSRQHDDTRGD
jgi:carbohydrate diacid regulator